MNFRVMVMLFLVVGPVGGLGAESLLHGVDYDAVPVRDVIRDLRTRSGLKIMVNVDHAERLRTPVTLHLNMIPADEVMRYAALAAGLGYEIDERKVVTITAADVLRTAFFQTKIDDRDCNSAKLQNFFASGGVTFPPGSKIEYQRNSNILTLVNTAENIRRAGLIVGGPTRHSPPRLRLIPEEAMVTNLDLAPKLNRLELDPVQRDDMKLSDLLLWMHFQTGVNLVAMPEVKADEKTLSLGLSRMSFRQMLDTICRSCGLVWRYDDYAIILALPTTPMPEPVTDGKGQGTGGKKKSVHAMETKASEP